MECLMLSATGFDALIETVLKKIFPMKILRIFINEVDSNTKIRLSQIKSSL